MAALAIALVNLFVRPIVNLLLLPIHLVTLGTFRWAANLVTLYLVTRLVPNLQIHAFTFPGLDLKYLIIPSMHFFRLWSLYSCHFNPHYRFSFPLLAPPGLRV